MTEKTRSEPKKRQVRRDAAAGAPAAGRRAGRAAGEANRAASRDGSARLAEGLVRAPEPCFGRGTLRAGTPRLRYSDLGFDKGASPGDESETFLASALGRPSGASPHGCCRNAGKQPRSGLPALLLQELPPAPASLHLRFFHRGEGDCISGLNF